MVIGLKTVVFNQNKKEFEIYLPSCVIYEKTQTEDKESYYKPLSKYNTHSHQVRKNNDLSYLHGVKERERQLPVNSTKVKYL